MLLGRFESQPQWLSEANLPVGVCSWLSHLKPAKWFPERPAFLCLFFSEAHLVEIDVDFKGNDVKVSN